MQTVLPATSILGLAGMRGRYHARSEPWKRY
jgi:hypothetical protein